MKNTTQNGETSLEIKTNGLNPACELEDVTTMDNLLEGFNRAMVTYYVDKNYKMHKILMLTEKEEDFWSIEEFGAAISQCLGNRDEVCLSKKFMYKIDGKKAKKSSIRFGTTLYRTLFGFIIDGFINDLRRFYERGQHNEY